MYEVICPQPFYDETHKKAEHNAQAQDVHAISWLPGHGTLDTEMNTEQGGHGLLQQQHAKSKRLHEDARVVIGKTPRLNTVYEIA